jgi:hypothetical protein
MTAPSSCVGAEARRTDASKDSRPRIPVPHRRRSHRQAWLQAHLSQRITNPHNTKSQFLCRPGARRPISKLSNIAHYGRHLHPSLERRPHHRRDLHRLFSDRSQRACPLSPPPGRSRTCMCRSPQPFILQPLRNPSSDSIQSRENQNGLTARPPSHLADQPWFTRR